MNFVSINGVKLETVVAITYEEQCKGLMFVKQAFPISFPMTNPGIKKFWMKDTNVPLDIIFSFGGSITKIEYGKPLCTDFLGPDSITDLVVELPFGIAEKIGAKVGDPISINYDKETIVKKLSIKLASVSHRFRLP